ncbi:MULTISPECIES: exodeoxyribonuclease VII large subunit [Chitinophagaceae]
MSEIIDDRKVFSLLEVNNSVKRTLAERYSSSFWVMAEMNKLNYYSHSGHCYPELVEKKDGKTLALMNGLLWRSDYERVNTKFLHVLQEPLKSGIKILFLASVNYDPVYGISLWIKDIDPSFSLGELEKEKQESIMRLHAEGIFDLNKSLPLAQLPKRIAIISVETSKGYADFLKVLEGNPFGYRFFHMLFPALLQGERSVPSIIRQLELIKKVLHHFDLVAIIRGGGGDVGLSSYNNYELAATIATFPIPVITGIGHSTNETVSEIVSYKNAITPTELADWLIQVFHNFAVPVHDAEKYVLSEAQQILFREEQNLMQLLRLFRSVSANTTRPMVQRLDNIAATIGHFSRNIIQQAKTEIMHLEKQVALANPENLLKRGFSMTFFHGKIVKSISDMQKGDTILTKMADGQIESIIENTEQNVNEN